MQLLGKLLGDPTKKDMKAIKPTIDKINALEPTIKALSDTELAAKTAEFRSQLFFHLKGGLVLEEELLSLFQEALKSVEPLAERCSKEELRSAITEYRQKIDRQKDPDYLLHERLQDTLAECFEQGYEKLAPMLNEHRIVLLRERASSEIEALNAAESSATEVFALLTKIDPQFAEVDSEMQEEAHKAALLGQIKYGGTEQNTLTDAFFLALLRHLQPELAALKADGMDALIPEMVKRYRSGKTLDDLLPEAFAVTREAGWRVIKMRHYDVQLIGGVVLHQGKIAEMRTGEGKTLVATLPVYLNALSGRGVHVVTVNDYLARRDSEWMGKIYNFLGLTVGVLVNSLDPQTLERRAAYQVDITYGTNNEFGFDYLRDNMVTSIEQMVQRELNFAIVDEVDNILIDEARTPLIISGQGQESTDMYGKFARWAPRLKPEDDYTIEEKTRTVLLTESGIEKIEQLAGVQNIYDEENLDLTRYMENAIKAEIIYKRDKDYIVKDGEVIIVDEFTGRQMPGRRYSEGLHQAIEAKEGVAVQRENHTLATITFQNYFRIYRKLGGMTGTALTEAEEFHKIYKLDVIPIPTNKPMVRADEPDLIYRTGEAKFKAVVEEIKERFEKKQPVLVGTTSVETSEYLSQLLEREGVPHQVLNAKYHEKEAQIVAQAGRSEAITIATNMAGRGTDILLGGNAEGYFDSILHRHASQIEYIRAMPDRNQEEHEDKENVIQEYIANMTEDERQELFQQKVRECQEDHDLVIELGGLHIIGTERHESRRIDNQLRGRAGRQGDPGSSRFFLGLDDELMRRFAADRVAGIMERVGMEEDMPLESKIVSRFIEGAQTRVEGYNFDIRKNVVDYDDVIAKQREVIYADRRAVLERGNMHGRILEMIRAEVNKLVDATIPGNMITEEEQLETLYKQIEVWVHVPEEALPENFHAVRREDLRTQLIDMVVENYEKRGEQLRQQAQEQGVENFNPQGEFERTYLLQFVDRLWMDHIDALDIMRAGIGFRAIGQRDPLVEFKNEAYRMFDDLKAAIQHYTADALLKLLRNDVTITLQRPEPPRKIPQKVQTNAEDIARASGQQSKSEEELRNEIRNNKQATKNGNQRSNNNGQRNSANQNNGTRQNTNQNNGTRQNNGQKSIGENQENAFTKVGRNDPCPCGSGRKFKKCHGA